ncbi:Bacterial leucyl aminopeptidase [Minicystis rosea]|nr:Bacterial leucyl aminopeptidase [Minicystis rosea]
MCLPPSLRRSLVPLSAAALLAPLSCTDDPRPDASEPVGDTYLSFEEWKARLPRDPNDGAYLVEDDIGVHDEASLREYHAEHTQPGALIVNRRDDGADDRWSETQKMNITYCVSPRFGARHDEVASAMVTAAADWSRAAEVRFVHRSQEDRTCNSDNENVLFQVVPAYGTTYNGRSFYPSLATRGMHELFVDLDNVADAAPKTLTGVLRHELGHVLGFRHEHTRPEANGLCVERPEWRALTPYDARSVMHYNAWSRCAGSNEGDYLLTPFDISGARTLYGSP